VLFQFVIIDQQCDAAVFYRKPDAITVLHQTERTARRCVGRNVENDGAEGCATHARVGNPDHVLDATLGELLRDRQIACLPARADRRPVARSDIFCYFLIASRWANRDSTAGSAYNLSKLATNSCGAVQH
jgi:hypothetical protein